MKGKSQGMFQDVFFLLYTGLAPPIYVPTTSFKLMTLEEALLFKSALDPMKLTFHPVQYEKIKRRKLKNVIMHCKKSQTCQIGFYSIGI